MWSITAMGSRINELPYPQWYGRQFDEYRHNQWFQVIWLIVMIGPLTSIRVSDSIWWSSRLIRQGGQPGCCFAGFEKQANGPAQPTRVTNTTDTGALEHPIEPLPVPPPLVKPPCAVVLHEGALCRLPALPCWPALLCSAPTPISAAASCSLQKVFTSDAQPQSRRQLNS
jgi:hypothetical protein